GGGAASPSTRPAELATHAAVTALVVAGIVWRLGGAFVYVLHAALVPALALGAHPVGGGPTRPAGRSRGRAGRGGHAGSVRDDLHRARAPPRRRPPPRPRPAPGSQRAAGDRPGRRRGPPHGAGRGRLVRALPGLPGGARGVRAARRPRRGAPPPAHPAAVGDRRPGPGPRGPEGQPGGPG